MNLNITINLWVLIGTCLLSFVWYSHGSLRHYQYDAGKHSKSRWIKNKWPLRASPANRIYNLHKLRDHMKHTKYLRRSNGTMEATSTIR